VFEEKNKVSIFDILQKNQAPIDSDANVLNVIDNFAKDVERFASSVGGEVSCLRELGFMVDYGQEWRVVIHKQLAVGGGNTMDYPHPLFRVYIPLIPFQEKPVRFDFGEDEMTICRSLEETSRALSDFAGRPWVAQTIQYLAKK
jgi:hypothetical protein